MRPGPQELGPERGVGGAEEAVEEEEAFECHAPAARAAEPPGEEQGERAERGGGDGEDSEEVVNVSVGQGSVVGRGGFYYYEFQVADAAGAGHLCVTHICVFFNGSEGSPESPLHAFFAAGELKF